MPRTLARKRVAFLADKKVMAYFTSFVVAGSRTSRGPEGEEGQEMDEEEIVEQPTACTSDWGPSNTIFHKMITVLTRYRPIVFDFISCL